MNQKLLNKLRRITPEEQAILDGRLDIQKNYIPTKRLCRRQPVSAVKGKTHRHQTTYQICTVSQTSP